MLIEETSQFSGHYLVLGGLLDPLEGVTPGQLRLDALRARLAEGTAQECILALGATLAAESTASHIKNLLTREFPGVRLTRLAQGIPLGAEVKYVDKETLSQSMMVAAERENPGQSARHWKQPMPKASFGVISSRA